ncbi:helix-turn-helix domain-containing protein [Paraglaciecola aquimarina]|uniref:Helix-turn-helix domain-containing protein n=1 Tax=Paraglaciecola algarum TaxID=3050085 RepID=A0ABS9DBJ6_9ALTE|nr:helix-turn-helix transcriptional regulator [Paraglaciecola sp. G1-23]MCF2950337.1 helix-turn-helix domain-containing protein [Paraglaciecola sp. G1-23]
MNLKLDSTKTIISELGDRIRLARLNADLTQKELANEAGISLKAVTNSEKGKSTLESFVAIMVALDLTEHLNTFLPKQDISPVQLAKLQGKTRQRATGTKKANQVNEDKPSW